MSARPQLLSLPITQGAQELVSRFRRRPPLRSLAIGALALLTVTVSSAWLSAAQDGARLYGHPTSIAVALNDVRGGELLTADNVEVRATPSGAQPEDALSALPPIGTRATNPIQSGQALTRNDVERGRSALAQSLPDGQAAIALPRRDQSIVLEIGDHIQIIGTGPDGGVRNLATAVVLSVQEQSATVTAPTAVVVSLATALVSDPRGESMAIIVDS